MSVEDKQEASSQGSERAAASAVGTLFDDVVPLEVPPEEVADQLARERRERVGMILGRGWRRRLSARSLSLHLPESNRRLLLVGGAIALGLLIVAVALTGRGGDHQPGAQQAAARFPKLPPPAARHTPLAPLHAATAHTRRRAALTEKRKGARRRADDLTGRRRAKQRAEVEGGRGNGADSGQSSRASQVEKPTGSTSYVGATASEEEAYEPAPPPPAASSPEEAAAREFDFEAQEP